MEAGYDGPGYALALQFDLLPDELRPKAATRTVEKFGRYGGHLSTGIQTTHRLMLELTRNGYHYEACRLLNLRTFPSWGFTVEQGATTIWERCDGYVKGRGFQYPVMNSFNHWALGAVGEWIWRHVVGINPDEAVSAQSTSLSSRSPAAESRGRAESTSPSAARSRATGASRTAASAWT
jgi:alpha-L-rhamnosidase